MIYETLEKIDKILETQDQAIASLEAWLDDDKSTPDKTGKKNRRDPMDRFNIISNYCDMCHEYESEHPTQEYGEVCDECYEYLLRNHSDDTPKLNPSSYSNVAFKGDSQHGSN